MWGHIVIISRRILAITAIILLLVLAVLCIGENGQAESVFNESTWKTEPEVPTNIADPPYAELAPPTEQKPVETVIKEGKEIPAQFDYNDPKWERPAYKAYWHSSYGRWSYVPNLIHSAIHRIFVTYPTASVFYDFVHDLGIAEESDSFEKHSGEPYDQIELVVMQTRIEKLVTLGNQVVVVGKPALTGLQALSIPVKYIKPDDPEESILFQLVTSDGDEIDYATIDYPAS